jgi:molybdopterin-guanine dinucleotide biosynthesis protein A
MGGREKSRLVLDGRTLLAHVQERLAPQCESLILNANGDPARFGLAGLPVVPDAIPGHQGPLAGILTALEWAAFHCPQIGWVASVPGDTPFIPRDLVRRLHETRCEAQQPLACAASGGRAHFAVGLWSVSLRHDLRVAVAEKGMRSIGEWAANYGAAEASWPVDRIDPFFNINTPEDLAQAEIWLSREGFR